MAWCIASFGIAGISHAETYYMDSLAGNDLNSGITETHPWKTVGRANRKQFAAGDALLFKRGREWFDVMISVDSPDLTIGAYGTGVPPRLVGSISAKISDWKRRDDGVYYSYFPRPLSRKDWTNWEVQLVLESKDAFYRKVDSLEELNGKGRFFYDKRSQYLYVKPLDPVVSLTKTFYLGRQENVVEIRHAWVNRLVVRDLEIALANRYGIGVWWQGDKVLQGDVLVEKNHFIGNAFSAVCLSGGMNYGRIDIRSNVIRMSGAEGIYIGRNTARSAVVITDNLVGDPGDDNFGWHGEGPDSAFNGDGIEVKTGNRGVLIARNTIRNLGYSGCGICTGSSSALISDNLIENVKLPGSVWTNPAAGIFLDIDDSFGVPTVRHNRIRLKEGCAIHVRGNAALHPPLVIEDNDIELAPSSPYAQILFSVVNSHDVRISGNRCRGGSYGLAFAPADDPPVNYLVEKNEFYRTSKSPFYFAQSMPSELRGLALSSNRVCGDAPAFIQWKSRPSDTTLAAAKRVLGPKSIAAGPCP